MSPPVDANFPAPQRNNDRHGFLGGEEKKFGRRRNVPAAPPFTVEIEIHSRPFGERAYTGFLGSAGSRRKSSAKWRLRIDCFSALGFAQVARYARLHRQTVTTALDDDLKKLEGRAFYRAEWATEVLQRYHAAIPSLDEEPARQLRTLHRWMFVPPTLWPFNVQDVLADCVATAPGPGQNRRENDGHYCTCHAPWGDPNSMKRPNFCRMKPLLYHP